VRDFRLPAFGMASLHPAAGQDIAIANCFFLGFRECGGAYKDKTPAVFFCDDHFCNNVIMVLCPVLPLFSFVQPGNQIVM